MINEKFYMLKRFLILSCLSLQIQASNENKTIAYFVNEKGQYLYLTNIFWIDGKAFLNERESRSTGVTPTPPEFNLDATRTSDVTELCLRSEDIVQERISDNLSEVRSCTTGQLLMSVIKHPVNVIGKRKFEGDHNQR